MFFKKGKISFCKGKMEYYFWNGMVFKIKFDDRSNKTN